MADEPITPRMFTEGEHYAMQDQAIARETAAAQAEIEELKSANAELSTKVDVLETEKAAAISRAEAAEQTHADYKAELEATAAREAKRDERKRQVAEANPALDLSDETEAGKARVERIVAMEDEAFEGYLADMREAAAANPVTPPVTPGAPPRESAAFTPTPTPTGDEGKASVRSLGDARRNLGKGA